MNIFDIMGPVMVGPSSSHTAGAARIGLTTRRLLGERPVFAQVMLHGSFASTGAGHGTLQAIVGGLLGMRPDDMRLPESFLTARQQGLKIETGTVVLRDVHPNTALLRVEGESGRRLEVVASSPGGGRIRVCRLDGIRTDFSGELPTLVVHNLDKPGHVAAVTQLLARCRVNIATMRLYRNVRGGYAVMVLECDSPIPAAPLRELSDIPGILKVTYLNTDEDADGSPAAPKGGVPDGV